MFHLFSKNTDPLEKVRRAQEKGDWAALSKAYYELGCSAMEAGDLDHAQLWLNRADTIYSADDGVYEKVGEKLIDDCSDRIGKLEEAEELFYNAVPAQIGEKAEELEDAQLRVWGLLSIARLVGLGRHLSALPGCEVLGELEWAVDAMLRSMQGPVSQEEYQRLLDLCTGLYELNGKPVYYTGEIEVPGGAAFQVFDLNGMFGAEQEVNGYINNHLEMLSALSRGMEPPEAERDIIGCALLPDHYVRTGAGELEKVPRIRSELARIWEDCGFVCSGITWKQVEERVAAYKALDILRG